MTLHDEIQNHLTTTPDGAPAWSIANTLGADFEVTVHALFHLRDQRLVHPTEQPGHASPFWVLGPDTPQDATPPEAGHAPDDTPPAEPREHTLDHLERCSGRPGCIADVHHRSCPHDAADDPREALDLCTELAGCLADLHLSGCPEGEANHDIQVRRLCEPAELDAPREGISVAGLERLVDRTLAADVLEQARRLASTYADRADIVHAHDEATRWRDLLAILATEQ